MAFPSFPDFPAFVTFEDFKTTKGPTRNHSSRVVLPPDSLDASENALDSALGNPPVAPTTSPSGS